MQASVNSISSFTVVITAFAAGLPRAPCVASQERVRRRLPDGDRNDRANPDSPPETTTTTRSSHRNVGRHHLLDSHLDARSEGAAR